MTDSGKSLQLKNRKWLLVFFFFNLAILVSVAIIGLDGVSDVIQWTQSNWKIPSAFGLAIAVVVTTVFNSLISPQAKAFLVYWRWPNPLPGHRVFTHYMRRDPRINPRRLQEKYGVLPSDPIEQNQVWYRIFQKHEHEASVVGAHQEFLLLRDMTWLSFAMFFLGLGLFFIGEEEPPIEFSAYLVVQYLLILVAARRKGISFVLNVLAVESVAETEN